MAYIVTVIINTALFYNAIIGIIAILYLWVVLSFLNGQYNLKKFICMISCTGTTIAISTFFIYGISEVATDYQQSKNGILYDFNSEAISISLALLFVFTLPIIILQLSKLSNNEVSFIEKQTSPSIRSQGQKNIQTESSNHEEWEEATEEDLKSGEFEII